jgi:hypothetical protein
MPVIVNRRIPLRILFFALLTTVRVPCAQAADTGVWWLNLRTTGYAYQTFDPAGATVDRLEGYQHVSGAVSGLVSDRLTLRFSARFADDLRYDADGFKTARLHAAQLAYRLSPRLRLTAGRQFIQEGVAALTLDGARLEYRPGRSWRATVWGGGRAPYDFGYHPGCSRKDTSVGARLETTAGRALRLGLSTAYRERGNVVAERPVGLDAAATVSDGFRCAGRAAYDLELDTWRRLEGQAVWRATPCLPEVTLQLLDRRPSVDAASWFARFVDADRIRMARLVVRHEVRDGVGGEVEYLGTFVDDRTSTRLGLAALLPCGRIGWSVRTGAAGEESGLYGELFRQLNPWLWVEGSAAYLSYSFWADDPLEGQHEVTTLAGRLRADLKPGLRLTAEIQRLETPEQAHDVRLLLGVNLSAAGGASHFGLTDGGGRP